MVTPRCPSASDDGAYVCILAPGHEGDHDYRCEQMQFGVSLLVEIAILGEATWPGLPAKR